MRVPGRSPNGTKYAESNQRLRHTVDSLEAMGDFERRIQMGAAGVARHLYKYRAIPSASDPQGRRQLEDLLLGNALWLATPDTFNDPFDGMAGYDLKLRGAELRAALERWRRRVAREGSQAAKAWVTSNVVANPKPLLDQYARVYERMRCEQIGVCALTTDPKNLLMWAHYSADHRGLCVQLRLSLDPGPLLAHPVDYSDEYPIISNMLDGGVSTDGAVLPLLRKSEAWRYEKEWRIVGLDQPNQLLRFKPEAMTGIILGLRTTADDRQYVRDLMDERERRFGTRPRLYQAERAPTMYRIRINGAT